MSEEIKPGDSVEVIMLKMRIVNMELELLKLRNEKNLYAPLSFCRMEDISEVNVDIHHRQLTVLAQWDMKRDPYTGQMHAIGRTFGGIDYRYFVEDPREYRREAQSHFLGQLHLRAVRDLAENLIKIKMKAARDEANGEKPE